MIGCKCLPDKNLKITKGRFKSKSKRRKKRNELGRRKLIRRSKKRKLRLRKKNRKNKKPRLRIKKQKIKI